MIRSLTVLVIPALTVSALIASPTVDVTTAEAARVRTHLATVEAELRSKDVSALTSAQRQARLRNLDVLHEYRVHGVFPVNTDFPGRRVPYFIDRFGTRCAMAYLIEQSGRRGADFVTRIATLQNNAYVRDLKDDPALGAWLRDNGLTAAEAARIQPSYGSPYADFEGRWEGKATFGPKDSVLRYALTTTDSVEAWTITFADRRPIPLRMVTFGGDSLVAEAGPLAGMTMFRTTLHYGGNVLTGTIEARYASGAVVRGRTEAVLECPGPATPENVVAFVRRANLPKVRCIAATGTILDGQAAVFRVNYRHRNNWFGGGFRTVLRWGGRVGWIVDNETAGDSAPPAFRARPSDTVLVSPAFLKEMSTLRLRFQWARTLLQNPGVPRFVPVGLIAALKDSLDEGLAALLVSAPSVTRDPELLAALAHLPVRRDSSFRRDDGGMVYMATMTGYASARDMADFLLWRQSLTLIADPRTPHEVLLTSATWSDRHLFSCGPYPSPHDVHEALRARAMRENDSAILAALARVPSLCK